MEIALSESAVAIHIFLTREMCLKYGRSTHFSRAKVKGPTIMMYTYSPQLLSLHVKVFACTNF